MCVCVHGSCIHTYSQAIKQIISLIQSKCNHITSHFQHNQEVKAQFCTAGTSRQQVKWWLYLPHRSCHQYFGTSDHSSGHLLTIYLHGAQKAVNVRVFYYSFINRITVDHHHIESAPANEIYFEVQAH